MYLNENISIFHLLVVKDFFCYRKGVLSFRQDSYFRLNLCFNNFSELDVP